MLDLACRLFSSSMVVTERVKWGKLVIMAARQGVWGNMFFSGDIYRVEPVRDGSMTDACAKV